MRSAYCAVGTVCALSIVGALSHGAEPAEQAKGPDVPVRAVALFSSGVGYFEHFGTVRGNGTTELRFKTEQINDVLKSLVLQDLDGGTAGTISYPSQEPLDRTLKSFQVDVTANPSLAELLNQLRGARLRVTVLGKPLDGTIVGVESRRVPGGKDAAPVEKSFLNLKAGRKVRSVPLEDVTDVELEDERLDAELDRALAALSGARDQDKKPVTLHFRGEGDRRVRVGYVVETPIWKTSYRLILSPRDDAAPKAGNAQGRLQGWAIVENQTDSDWDDVQLSLISGRPISFIQDLYHPLYVPRPVVVPELYASLRPQTYAGGVTPEELKRMKELTASAGEAERGAPDFALQSVATRPSHGGQGLFANSGGETSEPMDPAASVRALASGGSLGELFQYTVGNVSIPRQKSAMIPIVTDPVEVERVSVYNEQVLPSHPLTGVRLKNTTKNHLLQGPLTVVDGGGYAGDARLDNVPPGQERLLTYGVDLDTSVVQEQESGSDAVVTGKIVDGVLVARRSRVDTIRYTLENKGRGDKTLVLEYPREEDEELVEPAKADELTESVYRFRRTLPAGKVGKVTLRKRQSANDDVHLLKAKDDELAVYVSAKEIPADVHKVLDEVLRLKKGMTEANRQVESRRKRLAELTAEQTRIRENLKTVSDKSEYSTRLLKKLDEQETTIETLQRESSEFQKQLEQQRADLEARVRDLNVG